MEIPWQKLIVSALALAGMYWWRRQSSPIGLEISDSSKKLTVMVERSDETKAENIGDAVVHAVKIGKDLS